MKNILSNQERKLFTLFSRAIFANPFTPERREIDCQISGLPANTPKGTILEQVTDLAAEQIINLQNSGRQKITAFVKDADRELVKNLYLFHIFHQFSDILDRHILAQSSEKNRIIAFNDAKDALLTLKNFDFTQTESLHYFALFFQMRRAYFFIQRSLIGYSSAMMQLRAQLWHNIFTCDINRYTLGLWRRMEDFSTLLLGETGTGKSLAAAAIGRSGYIPFDQKKSSFKDNFATAFVSRNLSQYSEQLIESELFGHLKGAFTGAIKSHQGIFAMCSPHGSIFLDEIGDTTIPIQIKLLQVLQERIFSPVGSLEEKRFFGRVIVATNRPLEEMRRNGSFRNDFYFRLSSDIIKIPSLRERIAESPKELTLLIDFLLTRITGHRDKHLAKTVQRTITTKLGRDYPWNGNVRELEQCIRRVLLNNSCSGDQSSMQTTFAGLSVPQAIDKGEMNTTELTAHYCSVLYQKHTTYQAVSRITGLDWRTVKRYLEMAEENQEPV